MACRKKLKGFPCRMMELPWAPAAAQEQCLLLFISFVIDKWKPAGPLQLGRCNVSVCFTELEGQEQ